MCKFLKICSHIAGIVGAAIAIYLLCQTCPTADVKFDYIGIIVGILAILVTLLVTWNIYSAIRIEKKVEETLFCLKEEKKKQEENHDKLRDEVTAIIENVKAQLALASERIESAEQAYIMLFNATQAQVSALNKPNDNDFFQQYSHYQTALCAMLKCRHFPSDISYNIKALLGMMNDVLKNREESNSANDQLYDEDKREFIQNMEEISKSSREEFSFEDRQKFMEIAAKAKQIFKRTTKEA